MQIWIQTDVVKVQIRRENWGLEKAFWNTKEKKKAKRELLIWKENLAALERSSHYSVQIPGLALTLTFVSELWLEEVVLAETCWIDAVF